MVMVPMLYSDMSDTWRLSSRQQRFHIAAAGIINELLLAIFVYCYGHCCLKVYCGVFALLLQPQVLSVV